MTVVRRLVGDRDDEDKRSDPPDVARCRVDEGRRKSARRGFIVASEILFWSRATQFFESDLTWEKE